MRPQWGPVHGSEAVSEQSLIEQAMDRLPAGAVVVFDANSVFSVAYAADQRKHPVVLRLTTQRAQSLLGKRYGTESTAAWCGGPAVKIARAIPICRPRRRWPGV